MCRDLEWATFESAMMTRMTADYQGTAAERVIFVRPTYGQRANKRLPVVLGLTVAAQLVWSLLSGMQLTNALGALLPAAYGLLIGAAVLTMLVALLPGRPLGIKVSEPELRPSGP